MALTPEERERLRLTIQGLVNAALAKWPNADAGTLKDLWGQEVDRRLKRKPGGRKPPRKRPEVRASGG